MSIYFNETPVKTWYWLKINGSVDNLSIVDNKSGKEIKTKMIIAFFFVVSKKPKLIKMQLIMYPLDD